MAKLIELRNVYKIYSEGLESEVRALEGVSLENWPRLLSGVLATVSSANSIPILTEMGKNLAAQQHLIPAQVCFMVEIGAISDT